MNRFALLLLVAFPGEKPAWLVVVCAAWMAAEVMQDLLNKDD